MAWAKPTYYDRVWDTTTTTGTGSVVLSGTAPTGFRSFVSIVPAFTVVDYVIVDATGAAWEVGQGTITITTGVATLVRSSGTISASTNAGGLVNFAAGTKQVRLTPASFILNNFYVDWSNVANAPTNASQSQMEAASTSTVYVTPGAQQWHPGMCKAWVVYNPVTPVIDASYNIASVTDTGTGDATITIDTDFSSGNYCAVGLPETTAASPTDGRLVGIAIRNASAVAGSIRVHGYNQVSGAATDPARYRIAFLGDQ